MVTIHEFATLWQSEARATTKLIAALSEDVLEKKYIENTRTLGKLVNHIIHTIGEMGECFGLPVKERCGKPVTVSEMAAAYNCEAYGLLAAVQRTWKDESLKDELVMYGEKWTKGGALCALIMHQCHHRGQMTVLMRLAGLKVPGIYGPAQEEWTAMGMAAPME